MHIVKVAGLVAVLFGTPTLAAQGADPDWPCVQRKVEHLSLAVMWPKPVPDVAAPLPRDFRELADRMALRRVSLEEVSALVNDLAEEHPDLDDDAYGRIFAAAFEKIDRQRTRLVKGIARYAHGQTDLAHEIDGLRIQFDEAEAAAEPDFDRLDDLEAEIDWRERVFDDRHASLTYVCESPVLLEKRAYEVAQILLAHTD